MDGDVRDGLTDEACAEIASRYGACNWHALREAYRRGVLKRVAEVLEHDDVFALIDEASVLCSREPDKYPMLQQAVEKVAARLDPKRM